MVVIVIEKRMEFTYHKTHQPNQIKSNQALSPIIKPINEEKLTLMNQLRITDASKKVACHVEHQYNTALIEHTSKHVLLFLKNSRLENTCYCLYTQK